MSMILEFFSHIIYALIIPGIVIGIILIVSSQIIPSFLAQYKFLLLGLGILIVLFFVFQAGRLNVTNKYEKQALIDKALFAEEQVKSAKIDTKIVTEYVEKIKYVDRIKEVKTNVYVTKEADNSCPISLDTSNNISRLLNSASEGRLPDTTDRVDATSK